MAEVRTVSAYENSSKIMGILEQDGCIVIEGLLSNTEATTLQTNMKNRFDTIPDCCGDFYGHATKRMGALFSKEKMFQKMALFPQIMNIMDAYLLPGCSQYQINLTQAISIGPNERKQILHQDDPMFPFLHDGQELMLNCMWAIDDFTAENGATVLVPGSHKWPRSQALNLDLEDLPAESFAKGVMKKGSVLIYLGSLFHCGGENKTSARRCGAVISYSLGWLRQAENNYLAYTQDELQDMPERLHRLLGYFVHEPNLGSVNGIDPYDYWIKGAREKVFTEFVPDAVKPLLREYQETHALKQAS